MIKLCVLIGMSGLLGAVALGPSAQALESPLPANELGEIMILEYHRIGKPENEWSRTPENFRRDLQTLYTKNYYLVNLNDVLDGVIRVPAGKTPFVLTFDDDSPGQIRKISNSRGEVWDPDSAVGLILNFAEAHPDFGKGGTFYLNPVKGHQKWLREVVEAGFELGNHTVNHPKLSQKNQEGVAKEIAALQAYVEKAVPGYQIRSMALPFGIYPKVDTWAADGVYRGVRYHHDALLEVGAGPSASPFSKKFKPLHLPRIQVRDPDLGRWLAKFDANPERRFVSDGDPATLSVPASLLKHVRSDLPSGMKIQSN